MNNIPLNDTEKQIIALALFGYIMRAGPGQYQKVIEIAQKLGIMQVIDAYAKSWLTAPKDGKLHETVNSEAQATVKYAILNGIVTQWHHINELRFAFIIRDSIYKELFEGRGYNGAIKELIE